MIDIAGSVRRSFIFPADVRSAFEFYAHINRTLSFLDHISILQQYTSDEYRMLYKTTELGIYRVRVICDMTTKIDREEHILRIEPLNGRQAVKSKAGMYSLSGQGFFNSASVFRSQEESTEIDYSLKLSATLPVPIGLRFMPVSLVNEIARTIVQWRMTEIVENFIARSIHTYQIM